MSDYSKVLMMGAFPEPPLILCRNDKVQLMVQSNLHKDWAEIPPVFVVDDWPKDWEAGAVVVIPMKVIGTEAITSFSITGDISDQARKVLNGYINLCRASSGSNVSYRDLVQATGMNRRTIGAVLKELVDNEIGVYKYGKGFSLDIGTWRPDSAKAKALGIKIKEY